MVADSPDIHDMYADAIEEAIEEFALDQVQEGLENLEMPDPDEFKALLLSLADESDRAVPLVIFEYIRTQLVDLLESEVQEEVRARLLGGPLRSAGNLIDFLQGVYWLGPTTAADLRVLQQIRNRFAHRPFSRMEEEWVTDRLGQLLCLDEVLTKGLLEDETLHRVTESGATQLAAADPNAEEQELDTVDTADVAEPREYDFVWIDVTPRLKLIFGGASVYNSAVCELAVAPTAWRWSVHPYEALRADGLPEQIREFKEAHSSFLIHAIWSEALHQGKV